MSFLDSRGPLAPIFSASHVGIVILDSLGRTVFVNPRGRSLLGINDESKPFIDGKDGQVKPGLTGAAGLAGLPFKEIVEARRPVTGACLDATCREGPRRTLSASGYPVFGAAGRVDKVIFLIDDTLSEGIRKDAVLAEPEGFQAVFENAPIGIVHFDSQGTITACNESNAQIFGAGRDRIVGLNLEKDLVDERMKAAYETCRSGEIGRFEGEYVSVAGNKPIVARAAFVPLISGSGSFSGGIELVEDITERRKTEDMLEWQLRVNTAIAEISGSLIAPSVSVEKIAEIVLEHVKSITGSTTGCIASVDQETGDVSAHVTGCSGRLGGGAGGTDRKYGKKWEKAVGEAKAFFVNEPPENGSAGSSPGTPVQPVRFLYVPATDGGEPLGHIAVADSHRDYTKRDLNAVERLAHLYTLSLQRKNIEKKIERLATFPELNPYPIIEVDFSGQVTYRNRATSETLRRSGGLFEPTAFFPADMDEILAGCLDEAPGRFYREVTIGEFTFGEDIFCTPGFKTIRIYARDITAKRRSEEALQTAHDLLETKIQGRTNELLAANEALDDVRALLEKVVVAVDQVEEEWP